MGVQEKENKRVEFTGGGGIAGRRMEAASGPAYSCRTAVRSELWTWIPPL